MSLRTCAGCTTPYSHDLEACPHCGSVDYVEDGHAVARRLPLFVAVSCAVCGRGPWQLRLPMVMPGLVQLPALFCASCGSQVQVPWPPVEEDMSPKITVHGGATNARAAADPSPDAPASQPLVGAEADQGRPTPVDSGVVEAEDAEGEAPEEAPSEAYTEDSVALDEPGVDPYAGLTLAELRAAADSRGVASYGTKSQIADRLREADMEE